MVWSVKDAVLGATCFAGSAALLYLYDRYIVRPDFEKWEFDLKREMEIDRLQINKSLAFGIQTRRCGLHSSGSIQCQDLSCSYGPMSFMLEIINRAKKSVDVCIYIITAQVFADAFIDAFNRGLRVRIIADSDMSFSAQSSINEFRRRELPVRQRMSPFIMHHKFILVDDEIIMNGSLNFTMTGALGNWENVIVSTYPPIVHYFTREFQTMWQEFAPGKLISDTDISRHSRKTKIYDM